FVRRDLNAQRYPAKVRLRVGPARSGGVGEANNGRIRSTGLGEVRAQILGKVDEGELGVVDRERRLGVKGPVDRVRNAARAGRLRPSQLDSHDRMGEFVELAPLGLGAASGHRLGPLWSHACLLRAPDTAKGTMTGPGGQCPRQVVSP